MTAALAGVTVGAMTETPKKRVRNHKSSGTQWTVAQHKEAGHERLHSWIPGELKARIDALKSKHGGTVVKVLEAAITALEEKST